MPPFKLADGKYHKRTRTDSVTVISYTFPYIGSAKGASAGTSVISGKMSTKSKAEYSPPLPLLEICEKKKWIFSCNTLKLHYFSAPFMHLLCINDKKVITQDKPNEQNIFGTPPSTKFFYRQTFFVKQGENM